MVYSVMGKLRWKGGLERAEITILHRGAPGDRKAVPGRSVIEVKQGFFTYQSLQGKVPAVIPMHRIMEVRVDGEPAWKRP